MSSPPLPSDWQSSAGSNMVQAVEGPQPKITFHPVNSNITAGNNINFGCNFVNSTNVNNNMTVNNNPESSILTRLKTALNPVTSASYDSYEAKQRSECFPNTRVQVLNEIEAWIYSESHQAPVYILDGVAGIGKSTIAQTIATRAAALGSLAASFFFSRDEDLRKIARHFFPTISYQFGLYDSGFATSIGLSLDKNPDAPTKLLNQQLSLLILEPLTSLLSQRSGPTLLVIDALDECEEENAEELLSLLGQHVHRLKGLKVLITMRPEAHLRGVLDEDKNHERFRLHDIEESIVHSDIRLYLQCRLSADEVRKASRNQRLLWQPTANDMDMLCGVCGTLFIIAATATKFILDRKRLNPEKQLGLLLNGVSTTDFSGSKHTHILDETYVRIILAAQFNPDEIDEDWFKDLNKVLGSLIALDSPLSCNALASLLDMDAEDIEATLSQLHSLVAPSGSGDTMIFRIHHKSFPDFITDRERIQQVLNRWNLSKYQGLGSLLWIDVGGHHLHLTKACTRIMNHDLKWNMADINKGDWYNDKDDIPHVTPQLIARDLAYAVLHWASHLHYAREFETDLEVQNGLDKWASSHILAWMEVMVILNQDNKIYGILQDAIGSMMGITGMAWTERVRELLSDASRFVQQGSEVMKLSPIHIYRSCLPFIPMDTSLAKAYGRGMLVVGFGRSLRWDPLIATLIGHSGSVYSGSFSGDGNRLASGSSDKTIRLWDAKTGAHVYTLAGHSNTVRSVEFSSDSSQLASGSDDGTIRLWDVKTGAHISTLSGHTGSVSSVAFSGNVSHLASGSTNNTIRLWDISTGSCIFTLTGHAGAVTSIAFSIDGSKMASGSFDQTVRLWNVMTGAHILTLAGHSNWVRSVAFSNDGNRLASGSDDKTIRIWDVKTGAQVFSLAGHSSYVSSVAFSSGDSQLASGSWDKTIRLWDAKTGAHISTLTGHSGAVNSIAFSSDGTRLASASDDNTVRLWDPKQATHNSAPIGHLETVWSIAFSSDGALLASASADKTIRLWDATTGAHVSTLASHSDWVRSVAFSNDGSRLASGSVDQTIRVWDVKTGAHAFTLTGHSDWVCSVAFSPDDSLLASGSDDKTIMLWDAKTRAHVFTLSDHSDLVWPVAFSSDGSQLASGSRDRTIRLWDAKTGECISTFNGHSDLVYSVAFSSSGCMLASGSCDGTIRIWNASTGTHIPTLTGTTSWNFSNVISVAFLPDDSRMVHQLASCSDDLLRARDHLLALVKRKSPPINGLVMASSPSESEEESKWNVSVVCWFPPDMEVICFAVDHVNSRVAIGCGNGRIMALDFSSDISRPDEP